jgi:hypothetical protein
MIRLFAALGFAFVAFISFALGVADAYGPPLNETLDWLQEQINTRATNGGNGSCASSGTLASPCTWRYQTTKFSGCEVSWVFTQISHAQRGLESEVQDEITMPLWADFSPAPFATAGEGEIWRVVLLLKDDSSQQSRLTRTFQFGTLTSVQVETRTFAEIHFGIPGEDNKDMAERFAKAFSRAISLCQARKPKTPKPF